MIVKILTEHHLECLRLKGGCRGSAESTHVKTPHCWISHSLAHLLSLKNNYYRDTFFNRWLMCFCSSDTPNIPIIVLVVQFHPARGW